MPRFNNRNKKNNKFNFISASASASFSTVNTNSTTAIDLNVYSVENKRTKFTDYSYMTEFSDAPIYYPEPQTTTM